MTAARDARLREPPDQMKLPSILPGVAGVLFAFAALGTARADAPIRVAGSPVVSRVIKAAKPVLRDAGIEIKLFQECGNSQAATALGTEEIDVALMTRGLTAEERAAYPERRFEEYQIGTQAVAVLVSRAVWESGVHALTKDQATELYEGRIENWKQLGGEERVLKFYEFAHGHGVWELFAGWLYGETRKAPTVKWEIVNDRADAQNAVHFNFGAACIAPLASADGKEVLALAITDQSGEVIEPTPANIAAGKYPLTRPAFIVFGSKPAVHRKKLLDFLLGEKGQALVADNDLLPAPTAKAP